MAKHRATVMSPNCNIGLRTAVVMAGSRKNSKLSYLQEFPHNHIPRSWHAKLTGCTGIACRANSTSCLRSDRSSESGVQNGWVHHSKLRRFYREHISDTTQDLKPDQGLWSWKPPEPKRCTLDDGQERMQKAWQHIRQLPKLNTSMR